MAHVFTFTALVLHSLMLDIVMHLSITRHAPTRGRESF